MGTLECFSVPSVNGSSADHSHRSESEEGGREAHIR